jgi:Uma2 family endonuclease
MATGILVSEQEYLTTSYEPDCEFEDGVLIERNLGTRKHGKLAGALAYYFLGRAKRWNIYCYADVRFRLRSGRYRIPDLSVGLRPEPDEDILTAPPFIWIEILSPEDRPLRVSRKIREVLEFGAPYIWVIDPETLESELHTQTGSQMLTDGTLRIPNTEIVVPLADIFED